MRVFTTLSALFLLLKAAHGWMLGEWLLKLALFKGGIYEDENYLPHPCITIVNGPVHVKNLEFTDSGFTHGVEIYRDNRCQEKIPLKELQDQGVDGDSHIHYGMDRWVGSYRILDGSENGY